MTDDDQLGFEGLASDQPGPKKPTRTRRAASDPSAPLSEPHNLVEASLQPESTPQDTTELASEPKKTARSKRPAKSPKRAPVDSSTRDVSAREAGTERGGSGTTTHPALEHKGEAESAENEQLPLPTLPQADAGPDSATAAEMARPEVIEGETQPLPADQPNTETTASVGAQTAPTVKVEPAASGAVRLYFLTNQMNLNGVLSSRVLAPRESFHKYYADLLELTPGWVPLLTQPPETSFVERVVAERGSGAPVILELDTSRLTVAPSDGPVVYVRAARFADVTAIHFRDRKSLREHRARGYSNVHPQEHLLQVSPALFTSPSDTDIALAPPDETTTDWLHLDRVRGAASGALAASDTGEALLVAAGLFGAGPLPSEAIVPPWLNWSYLSGGTAAPTAEDDAERADGLIFEAAYRALGERDQMEAWSPSEVLESVAADIAHAGPGQQVRAIVDRNLQRVRELINLERDFEPFRNPGSPYVAAKALLMVLLRPDLKELLAWPSTESGADETTRVVAAVLAGRLRGLARESVDLRSIVFDDASARWAVQAASGHDAPLGAAEVVADSEKTVLMLNGEELRSSSPLMPDPVALYEALTPEAQRSARVSVSRELKWPMQVRVHLPTGVDVQQTDSSITITSTETVTVETLVSEGDFLARLGNARDLTKAIAVTLLQE